MRVFNLWDPPKETKGDWAAPKPKLVEGTEDWSDLLGAGVYVLWFRGRAVHVDWAPHVLERIATHRQLHGERVPSFMPVQGFKFDRFTWKKCPEHKSQEALRQLKEALCGESAVS